MPRSTAVSGDASGAPCTAEAAAHPSLSPKRPVVPVSLSRLLSTRALPWLAALTVYDAVRTASAPSTTTPPPVSPEALFALYSTMRQATTPTSSQKGPIHGLVSSSPPRAPTPVTRGTFAQSPRGGRRTDAEEWESVRTSSTALAFLVQASSAHPSLRRLHTALSAAVGSQAPSRDDRRGASGASAHARFILSSPCLVLNAALEHAAAEGTHELLQDALETLSHCHEYGTLSLYTDDLAHVQHVLNTLDRTEATDPALEDIMKLARPPPLEAFFTYLLTRWHGHHNGDNRLETTACPNDDGETITHHQTGHCGDVGAPAPEPNAHQGTDGDDERTVAATTRAVLLSARRLDAERASTDASRAAHAHWRQRVGAALIALTAALLADPATSMAVRTPLSRTAGDRSDSLYALVDLMTRSAECSRIEAVLAPLSAAWHMCVDDSATCATMAEAADVLQRTVVLALARAVDRAPTALHALETTERHWRGAKGPGTGVRSARGLLAVAEPVVLALMRRSMESTALWLWWRRVVLESAVADASDGGGDAGSSANTLWPSTAGSAPPLTTSSATPAPTLSESFWSALLSWPRSSDDVGRGGTACEARLPVGTAARDETEVLRRQVSSLVKAAAHVLRQALQHPDSHTLVQWVAGHWFAGVSLAVHRAPQAAIASAVLDRLVRGFEEDILCLFHTEAERVDVLGQSLLALASGDAEARQAGRLARQSLLRVWMGRPLAAIPASSLSLCDVSTSTSAPPDSPATEGDFGTGDTHADGDATSRSALSFLARLDAVVRTWVDAPPYRLAHAVYLLDDATLALEGCQLSAGQRRHVPSAVTDLVAHTKESIMVFGFAHTQTAPAVEPSTPTSWATVARTWATLLASFSSTRIHTRLFGDVEHVVLLYWLLDALAQDQSTPGGHPSATGSHALPLTKHELEAAARGIVFVAVHAPVDSVLPPMVLNWLVSPAALQLPWKEAAQFLRSARPEAATAPRGFLFLALPLDRIRDTSHAVRVLLALHAATAEMKSHVEMAEATSSGSPRTQRRETTVPLVAPDALVRLYMRIRVALFYSWCTRSLSAVLAYYREHVDQLQTYSPTQSVVTSTARGSRETTSLASSSSSHPHSAQSSHSLAPDATRDVLEDLAGPAHSLRERPGGADTNGATGVSTAILCSYMMRERWVWQAMVLGSAPVNDAAAASHRYRLDDGSTSNTRHTPASREDRIPLHEWLLHDYVALLQAIAASSRGLSADEARLAALLYAHLRASHPRVAGEDARDELAAQRAKHTARIVFCRTASAQEKADEEAFAERVLPADDYEALCARMQRLFTSTVNAPRTS